MTYKMNNFKIYAKHEDRASLKRANFIYSFYSCLKLQHLVNLATKARTPLIYNYHNQ